MCVEKPEKPDGGTPGGGPGTGGSGFLLEVKQGPNGELQLELVANDQNDSYYNYQGPRKNAFYNYNNTTPPPVSNTYNDPPRSVSVGVQVEVVD